MFDTLTRRGRKAATPADPPTPTPADPPTMLEEARAALAECERLVQALAVRRQEAAAMLRDLPPIDLEIPLEERLESETRITMAKQLAERFEREYADARALHSRRQSELATVEHRAREAARAVAYRRGRYEPLARNEAELRAALAVLRPLVADEVLRGLPAIAGAIATAENSLSIALNHTLVMYRQELDAALDEQARVGVLE